MTEGGFLVYRGFWGLFVVVGKPDLRIWLNSPGYKQINVLSREPSLRS